MNWVLFYLAAYILANITLVLIALHMLSDLLMEIFIVVEILMFVVIFVHIIKIAVKGVEYG